MQKVFNILFKNYTIFVVCGPLEKSNRFKPVILMFFSCWKRIIWLPRMPLTFCISLGAYDLFQYIPLPWSPVAYDA